MAKEIETDNGDVAKFLS